MPTHCCLQTLDDLRKKASETFAFAQAYKGDPALETAPPGAPVQAPPPSPTRRRSSGGERDPAVAASHVAAVASAAVASETPTGALSTAAATTLATPTAAGAVATDGSKPTSAEVRNAVTELPQLRAAVVRESCAVLELMVRAVADMMRLTEQERAEKQPRVAPQLQHVFAEQLNVRLKANEVPHFPRTQFLSRANAVCPRWR